MKKIIIVFVCVCACLTLSGKQKKDQRLQSTGFVYLQNCFSQVDATQKAIHRFAEVGYKEYRSAELLENILEKEGFKVERGVAGIPTAFVATFGSGKPVIGLLGEYDALPGLSQDTCGFKRPIVEGEAGHGCGHNLIGTAPCYAAIAISKWLAEGHTGTVIYFGCPAEEGGGGKAYMTRDGVFNGCDAILQWHPGKKNRVSLNTGLCSLNVMFTFSGSSAHASGSPWKGRSALDAVEAMDYMTNMMREHMKPDCRMHYVILNGGEAPNVVPDKAVVNYYFRSPDVNDMMELFHRAVKAAEGAAMGTGTRMSYEIINGNYAIMANEQLSRIVLENLKTVGGVKLDEREKALCLEILKNSGSKDKSVLSNFETIVPEVEPLKSSGGSSDVGNVSQVVPLHKLNVAYSVAGGGHCWQNTAVSGTTIGTKVSLVAAKTMYLTALDLYTDKAKMKAVRDEFEAVHGPGYKYVPLVGDRKAPLDYRDAK
ncbi:MAG: amidohydrolase [Bacteroidales bacterium]|nr:amidohydrolase [Bacteroidales bacterium]